MSDRPINWSGNLSKVTKDVMQQKILELQKELEQREKQDIVQQEQQQQQQQQKA